METYIRIICGTCGSRYQSTRDRVYFCYSCQRLTNPHWEFLNKLTGKWVDYTSNPELLKEYKKQLQEQEQT